MTQTNERERILDALVAWIAQRPRLEFGNYGNVSSYRSELRSITRDLHHARLLLSQVRWRDDIDAAALKVAFHHAFSGRLSWDGERLDYCTGQYWPTEYRRAACAVLANALWTYARENLPDGTIMPGDVLRRNFRKEYGRAIAARYFD